MGRRRHAVWSAPRGNRSACSVLDRTNGFVCSHQSVSEHYWWYVVQLAMVCIVFRSHRLSPANISQATAECIVNRTIIMGAAVFHTEDIGGGSTRVIVQCAFPELPPRNYTVGIRYLGDGLYYESASVTSVRTSSFRRSTVCS